MLLHLNECASGEHLQLHSVDLDELDVLEQLLEVAERSDVGDEVEPAEFGQLSQLSARGTQSDADVEIAGRLGDPVNGRGDAADDDEVELRVGQSRSNSRNRTMRSASGPKTARGASSRN